MCTVVQGKEKLKGKNKGHILNIVYQTADMAYYSVLKSDFWVTLRIFFSLIKKWKIFFTLKKWNRIQCTVQSKGKYSWIVLHICAHMWAYAGWIIK